jgi:hypothetical protein
MGKYSDEGLDRLFAAARSDVVDSFTPEEHFETRLMARIAERREQRVPWFMSAWRMIPVFAVLTVLIAVCSITYTETQSDDLFASITSGQDELISSSVLEGE